MVATVALAGIAGCGSSSSSQAGSSGLISSSECAANKAAGTITYVSPFGFDASSGIIDVFAADKLGYFKDLCLKVQLITNSEDATSLVSAGRATTTNVGSAADFLAAVGSGSANIKGVATYGDTSDYCIMTNKAVTTLKQLEGKKLAYHFVQEAPDLELLHAAGVDLSKINFVNDSNYDPNQIIAGTIDGLDCYQSNEPLVLKAEGKPFNEFTPKQYGVTGTYNVEFFNTAFLTAHYGAAKDWMRADLHAYAYCETHQAQCVSIEGDYAKQAGSDFDTSHEQQVWALESKLSADNTLPGKGIGVESYAEWQPEASEVTQFNLVKTAPSLKTYEDVSMIGSLYDGKKLIWP